MIICDQHFDGLGFWQAKSPDRLLDCFFGV